MSDDDDLVNLDLHIAETRKDYFRHRDHLRLLIEEARGPAEGLEALLAVAEEFGAEAAMERLATAPERLGFDEDTPLRTGPMRDRVADALSEATDANYELGYLIGGRERILCERDPERQRVYNFDGREVVLDVAREKVRYLDEPNADATLTIEAVDPSHEPTREFLRGLKRERGRQRERRQ